MTPRDAIEQLKIPYIPHWSFGERLPAIEESTSDPASLGHAYEILARVLAARLDWYAALQGETPAPPPMPRRSFNEEWLERHRKAAELGLASSGLKGSVETWHFSPDSSISKAQPELLVAARQAQVTAHGWPTGLVLDGEGDYPKPLNDGVIAEISRNAESWGGTRFVYWTLAKNGDFYSLMSLPEDSGDKRHDVMWFENCIVRAAETLLHCSNLYRALGVEPGAHVEITIRYQGLTGRSLRPEPGSRRVLLPGERRAIENEVTVPTVGFRLEDVSAQLAELVKELCEPLFVLFDFTSFKDEIYAGIVSDFLKRIR